MRYLKNILKLLAINIYDKNFIKQVKKRKLFKNIDENWFIKRKIIN